MKVDREKFSMVVPEKLSKIEDGGIILYVSAVSNKIVDGDGNTIVGKDKLSDKIRELIDANTNDMGGTSPTTISSDGNQAEEVIKILISALEESETFASKEEGKETGEREIG